MEIGTKCRHIEGFPNNNTHKWYNREDIFNIDFGKGIMAAWEWDLSIYGQE